MWQERVRGLNNGSRILVVQSTLECKDSERVLGSGTDHGTPLGRRRPISRRPRSAGRGSELEMFRPVLGDPSRDLIDNDVGNLFCGVSVVVFIARRERGV